MAKKQKKVIYRLADYLNDPDDELHLAQNSGVSIDYIRKIKANRVTGVSLVKLGQLASALGISPGELVGWDK